MPVSDRVSPDIAEALTSFMREEIPIRRGLPQAASGTGGPLFVQQRTLFSDLRGSVCPVMDNECPPERRRWVYRREGPTASASG